MLRSLRPLYLRILLRVYKACCHATYLRFCPLILPLFYYLNIFNPFYSKIHDPTSPQRCRIRLDLAAPGCYWCLVDWAVNVINIKDKYTLSTKKSSVCFLAMSQLKFVQIQKVRSVLKSACSEDFKTVLTFEIWPSRSWENWGQRHQGSFSVFTFLCNFKPFFCVISTKKF